MDVYSEFVLCWPRYHHGFPNNVEHELGTSVHSSIGQLDSDLSIQGMVTGWAVLSPLAKHSGWAPGPVSDMTTGSRGWILWISLAIMCSDSLVSLIPVVYNTAMELIHGKKREESENENEGGDSKDPESEDRLVPTKWVVTGWTVSVIVGTILVWVVFGHQGIKPWATFIGFLLGGLLSILA